jgi:O-antigen biosynthesis protein WbqP
VAISIFIEDGMPIFFKQKRVGINYTFFNIYKFRSMNKNTPNVATHLLENPGQYLLKIGGLLRKLSLDELPNMINIINNNNNSKFKQVWSNRNKKCIKNRLLYSNNK